MLKGVAGQGGMVYFQVQFHVFQQIVFLQKAQYRCRIVIVLMFGWFTGFWLDKESAFKTLATSVVNSLMQKHSQVLLLAFHICVQQSHIALASTPEHIVLTT